jgi:predicted Zn finger-like uncharacterized protein
MILTRCSYCGTVFRVTPEQLRIRNGQVRCGHCDAVFNALDFLEDEQDTAAFLQRSFSNHIPAVPVPTLQPELQQGESLQSPTTASPMVRRRLSSQPEDPMYGPTQTSQSFEWGNERDRYNQTMDNGLAGLVSPKPQKTSWLITLLSIPLFFLLAAQILYTYRTPFASNSALFAAMYQGLNIHVPLARITELVAIESTDLQADQPNKQLLLLATLRNQATFNQAWPSLELTLIDAGNSIISRRVLQPSDYLAEDAPPALAARSELALRLRLSAEGINAANYRLYVFYP